MRQGSFKQCDSPKKLFFHECFLDVLQIFGSSYFWKLPRWPVSVLDDYIIPHRWNHGKHSWSSNLDNSHQAYSFREERELSFIDQFHGRLLHLRNSKILKILFLFTNYGMQFFSWEYIFISNIHYFPLCYKESLSKFSRAFPRENLSVNETFFNNKPAPSRQMEVQSY